MLCTSKESLEHVEFRFRCKKIDFFEKNLFFFKFLNFFSKGGPFDVNTVKKSFFDFSKISKKNLKNDFPRII